MSNKWKLDYHDADKELAKTNLQTNSNVRHAFVLGAEIQSKRLLNYLENKVMPNHMRTIDGLSCTDSCDVCVILKEAGVEIE